MEKENTKIFKKSQEHFKDTHPIYTNISLQFTGIGHLVVYGNALISFIEEKYSLRVETLPLYTYKHAFMFLLSNLKASGFDVITIFYEEEENLHRKVVLEYLKSLYPSQGVEEIGKYLKNERVALVVGDLSEKSRVFLFQCLCQDLYVTLLERMEFCIPFVYAFVFTPLPVSVKWEENVKEEEVKDSEGKDSEEKDSPISKGEVSRETCLLLLKEGFNNFDEQKWKSKEQERDKEGDSKIQEGDKERDKERDSTRDKEGDSTRDKERDSTRDKDCLPNILSTSPSLLYPLPNSPTLKDYIPEQMELDLLVNFKQINLNSSMIHFKNIQRSAMSLFNGRLLFSPIVRETGKTKPLKISKKQQAIIEASEKRIKAKEEEQDKLWLRNFYSKYVKADREGKRLLLETVSPDKPSLYKRILLLKIEYYSDIWKLELHSEDCDERLLIPCYSNCMEFIEKYSDTPDSHLEYVIQTLIDCGFEATAHEIIEKICNECNKSNESNKSNDSRNNNNKSISKNSISNRNNKNSSTVSSTVFNNLKFYTDDTSSPSDYDICFQLKYMGDKLKRSLGSRKDKRVLFEPDGWQIQLLDLVDQNKSAVVAAPTSSGKTFICFYAIEKILRESDESMVIFCLPTKALANQVSADIYARFSPKQNCKLNIQGFLMKDNSNDPFNCQVLIIIPSLLESILNSPPSKGLSKIKYIIIDEVHKISSEEMGSPIERIFHLSPCPLLVLSATLGNLEGFYGWMKSIEESKGRECELVVHKERYCELKPFVFTAGSNKESGNRDGSNKESGSSKGKESGSKDGDTPSTKHTPSLSHNIIPINNLFSYSYEHIRKFGFGNDINFLPEELLELFDTLCNVLTEEQKELLYPLVPENFFKSNILTKRDCKEYERHLLNYFQGLIKEDRVSEKQIKAVYKLLTRESRKAFENLKYIAGGEEYIAGEEEYIAENIIDLLTGLKEKDMLPCIVFNTDRDFINRLAVRVYHKLEAQDKDVKKNKAMEKMKKETKRSRDVEKGKDSWIEESMMAERSYELKDDKKNIKYTFLDPSTKMNDYEVQQETKYIKNTPPEFIDMIYRGMGVHHEQMNRRYRNVAEILFRQKHIRVLFATDTLALGINMPCRTVVFAGDSLLLDPLNYKQMAGRAGRRGYDTLGNVVFMGIPQRRVQNLLVSRLPNIKGVYTYTNSSFVGFNIKESLIKYPLLESTFYCEEGGEYKVDRGSDKDRECKVDRGSDKVDMDRNTLLSLDSLSLNSPSTHTFNSLSPRLCNELHFYDLHNIFLDLHKREALVNLQTKALSSLFDSYLKDLIISNRDTDPSIFIFVLLLQSNLLDYEPLAFMNTLSHIFEVRPLLFPSSHTLPPLPLKVFDFCSSLNSKSVEMVSSFYSPVVRDLQSKCTTPLHNILSFLQSPHLDSPKNSYLLDFFKHSNVRRIREENKVRSADLFKSLSVINTVFTSLIRLYVKYDLDKETLRKIQGIFSLFEPKFKAIFA